MMSHFEYISVAIALMYALLMGRLLSGLSPSFNKSRRYPIHLAWVVTLILVSILQWWVLWRTNEIAWTPFRFLWVLAMPAVLFIRAGILLGERPGEVVSYQEHFFQYRVQFFSLGIASAILIIFAPWVFGAVPWFTAAPLHPSGAVLGTISIAGLAFKGSRPHAIIVLLSFLLVASSFLVIPVGE